MLANREVHPMMKVSILYVLAVGLTIHTAQAQNPPCVSPAESKVKWQTIAEAKRKEFECVGQGLPRKPLYRAPEPGWHQGLTQSRALVDQMISNGGGRDDFLQSYPWDLYEDQIVWASEYIRLDKRAQFEDLYRELQARHAQVREKKVEIHRLRMTIHGRLKATEGQFKHVIHGEGPIRTVLNGLKLEGAGVALEKALEKAAEHTAGAGTKIASGGAKALGVAVLLYHLSELYQATDKYEGAKLILPDLLEQLEIYAYLTVLEKRYDQLLEIDGDIADLLLGEYLTHLDTCHQSDESRSTPSPGIARGLIGRSIASSVFHNSTDGWTIEGDADNLTAHSDYISARDQGKGEVWYFVAPKKFLGDRSASYGYTLRFELSQLEHGSAGFSGPLVEITDGSIGTPPLTVRTRSGLGRF